MANGPRVFYVMLVQPIPEGVMGVATMKISARGYKSAAEAYVLTEYPRAMRYKADYVKVRVCEGLHEPGHLFSITTTVTAKRIRG